MVAITTNEDNAVTTGNDIFSNDTDLDGDGGAEHYDSVHWWTD